MTAKKFTRRLRREGENAFEELANAFPPEYRDLATRFIRALVYTSDVPYNLVELADTPALSALSGKSGKALIVNSAEDGFEVAP